MKTTITKEEIKGLPVTAFNGRIITISTEAETEKAVAYLSKFPRIGIDTETRPAFRKGVSHKVALMQLSTEDTCFLLRLNYTGLTDSLTHLLENPAIEKVGLSLRDDFHGLRKWREFEPRSVIELQTVAKEYGIRDESLQKIYALLFGEKISKAQRLTNWESDTLTDSQKQYAAIDAWACYKIYNRLLEMKPGLNNEQ